MLYILFFSSLALIIFIIAKLCSYYDYRRDIKHYQNIVMEFGPSHQLARMIRDKWEGNVKFQVIAGMIDNLWRAKRALENEAGIKI